MELNVQDRVQTVIHDTVREFINALDSTISVSVLDFESAL